MTMAPEALASSTSLSVMAPTPRCTTSTLTSGVESWASASASASARSEEHTSELQSLAYLVCRLLLEKKKKKKKRIMVVIDKHTNEATTLGAEPTSSCGITV